MKYFVSFFAHGGESRHGSTVCDALWEIHSLECIQEIERKILEMTKEKYPDITCITISGFQLLAPPPKIT